MIRGYDSGRSHLLPFEATQHTKKDKPIYIYIYVYIYIYLPVYYRTFHVTSFRKQPKTASLLRDPPPAPQRRFLFSPGRCKLTAPTQNAGKRPTALVPHSAETKRNRNAFDTMEFRWVGSSRRHHQECTERPNERPPTQPRDPGRTPCPRWTLVLAKAGVLPLSSIKASKKT